MNDLVPQSLETYTNADTEKILVKLHALHPITTTLITPGGGRKPFNELTVGIIDQKGEYTLGTAVGPKINAIKDRLDGCDYFWFVNLKVREENPIYFGPPLKRS